MIYLFLYKNKYRLLICNKNIEIFYSSINTIDIMYFCFLMNYKLYSKKIYIYMFCSLRKKKFILNTLLTLPFGRQYAIRKIAI